MASLRGLWPCFGNRALQSVRRKLANIRSQSLNFSLQFINRHGRAIWKVLAQPCGYGVHFRFFLCPFRARRGAYRARPLAPVGCGPGEPPLNIRPIQPYQVVPPDAAVLPRNRAAPVLRRNGLPFLIERGGRNTWPDRWPALPRSHNDRGCLPAAPIRAQARRIAGSCRASRDSGAESMAGSPSLRVRPHS